MRNLKFSFIVIFVLALVLGSCTRRFLDFTMVSTKNVDLSKASTFERSSVRASGEDGVYWVLWIPLGYPNLKEAVDRAIESTPGAVALVDGVVYSKGWWAILTGYSAYIVEGTPLLDPSLVSNQEEIGKYNLCRLDRKGNIKEQKIISEEEFVKAKKRIVSPN